MEMENFKLTSFSIELIHLLGYLHLTQIFFEHSTFGYQRCLTKLQQDHHHYPETIEKNQLAFRGTLKHYLHPGFSYSTSNKFKPVYPRKFL